MECFAIKSGLKLNKLTLRSFLVSVLATWPVATSNLFGWRARLKKVY